jgi:hypothetical protein
MHAYLLPLLFLTACEAGKVTLDDTAADTAADDTDTDDTDDTVADANAWTGTWDGGVALVLETPDGEAMPLCEGEGTVEVEADGAFAGDATCGAEGAPGDILVAFEGTVDDDGALTGTALQTMPDGVEFALTVGGRTDEGVFGFVWEGEMVSPRGDEVAAEGTFFAE